MIRPFLPGDTEAVVSLWQATGLVRPWNDPYEDIATKLALDDDLLLVALDGKQVVGTVMVGYDGHRGWVNYLAVAPSKQRQGLGHALMDEAERRLVELGCPKLNLQVRSDNAAAAGFYEALGYRIDEVVSWGKRLDG